MKDTHVYYSEIVKAVTPKCEHIAGIEYIAYEGGHLLDEQNDMMDAFDDEAFNYCPRCGKKLREAK